MKKNIFGRKFKRDKNERKALFKSLLSELVMHGRITTTEQKAKSIKSTAEKMVKKAQKEFVVAQKLLSTELIPAAIEKMTKEIAPKFTGRNGGYTRIIRLGKRFNDDASMVMLEWVEGVGQIVKGPARNAAASAAGGEKAKKSQTSEVVEGEIVTEAKDKKTKKTAEKKDASTSSAQEKKSKQASKKKAK